MLFLFINEFNIICVPPRCKSCTLPSKREFKNTHRGSRSRAQTLTALQIRSYNLLSDKREILKMLDYLKKTKKNNVTDCLTHKLHISRIKQLEYSNLLLFKVSPQRWLEVIFWRALEVLLLFLLVQRQRQRSSCWVSALLKVRSDWSVCPGSKTLNQTKVDLFKLKPSCLKTL